MQEFTSTGDATSPADGSESSSRGVEQPNALTISCLLGTNKPPVDEAAREVEAELSKLPQETFAGLDPKQGNGVVTFDLTEAIPPFLHEDGGSWLRPLGTGTWAFDGDPDVPHYVSIPVTSNELGTKLGADKLAQLQGFGKATTEYIRGNLPAEERARMDAAGVEFILDLAELRISDGSTANTGHNVHLDLYPREGMVMVIPIIGSHTTIYYPPVDAPAASGRIVATLLTAYERWTRFHGFDPTDEGQPGSRVIMAGDHRVVVPEGMHAYWQTRGEMVPADMGPDVPGLLPTIHRAGTGARTILVLNFHYAVVTGKK